MSEADLLRMIEEKYDAMPKAERVEILSGICDANPEQKKFMKKFFPRFYKEIHAEEDAKQRRPKRRKKLLR